MTMGTPGRGGPAAFAAITEEERVRARELLGRSRVAVFIPGYNVQDQVASVVDRIPDDLRPLFAEIFVIDNHSPDGTSGAALEAQRRHPGIPLGVFRTPSNRGYGGNQKLGYLYCMEKGHDIVVMLHGDGQYAPEFLPRILAAFAEDTDAVFGSRMINKRMALQGGMPLYKWVGNQILTAFENRLLGTRLSEFHTGYRAYRVSALRKIPFVHNSDDFHFDTEIIVQAVATGWSIREVAIPTHYGSESCNVNGMRYAFDCAKAVLRYTLVNLGLLYERNYDFGPLEVDKFRFKRSPNSLHQYLVRGVSFPPDAVSAEIGAHEGALSSHIAGRVGRHIAVDRTPPRFSGEAVPMGLDLDGYFSAVLGRQAFDCVLSLDVIEHINNPERFLNEVFSVLKPGGTFYVSTANICYLPSRILLFLGQASYGKIGILDKTHRRLFTVGSLKKLLAQEGFEVMEIRGFPPPLTDLVSEKMRRVENVHAFLSRHFPKLFAYHFLAVAKRLDAVTEVLKATVNWKDGREEPSDGG